MSAGDAYRESDTSLDFGLAGGSAPYPAKARVAAFGGETFSGDALRLCLRSGYDLIHQASTASIAFLGRSSMKQFLTELRTTAWRTAGARYNAARRLQQREWLSTFSIAALSASSIAVAFAQKVYVTPGTPLDNYLSSLAVALGVFLLAISLVEWGAGYGAKAESLHRNAENLTAFQLKLAQILAQFNASNSITSQEVDALRLEYEAIKDKCPCNHKPIDDELFRAQKRIAVEFSDSNGKPKMNRFGSFWAQVCWRTSELWFFGVVWILVLGALARSQCL